MDKFIATAKTLNNNELFELGIRLHNDLDCADDALAAIMDLMIERDENLFNQFALKVA